MDLFPYLITLVALTLLLTLARFNVVKLKNSSGVLTEKYSTIGIILLVFSYIIFVSFSIFRKIDVGFGGTDAYEYKLKFLNANGNFLNSIAKQAYEPGYAFIIWFSRIISDDYRVALFLIYSIMFFLIVKFIKDISWSKYIPISIFLILTLWLNSFNTTRAILALFIGTFVYSLLIRKKYKMAMVTGLIATSIHTASLVLFLIIAVVIIIEKKRLFSRFKLFITISGISFIFLFSIKAFEVFIKMMGYGVYLDWRDGEMAFGTVIIAILSFIIGLTNFSRLYNINEYNKIWLVMLPVCIPIFILQLNFAILYRMLLFFLPIMYILIPDIIRSISIKSSRDFMKLPIKILLFVYLTYRIYSFLFVELKHVGVPYISELIKL